MSYKLRSIQYKKQDYRELIQLYKRTSLTKERISRESIITVSNKSLVENFDNFYLKITVDML